MDEHDTPVADLLTQGIAAARAGDNERALQLLRRVTEQEPERVEGWLWRASVASTPADKRSFLEEALSLDPDNAEARLALDRLREIEGELAEPLAEEEVLFCTVHPSRETRLRCNRCARPMCTDCAVRHPVGLRCRECVNETRSPVYQIDARTLLVALAVGLLLSTGMGLLVLLLGRLIFWFFWLFIGGALGRVIAEGVRRAVPRKQGRALQAVVALSIIGGVLLAGAGIGLLLQGPLAMLPTALAGLFQLHVLIYLGTALTVAVGTFR